uniref:Uncharacterized protein n=1 Tax=Rhizophora mucronata TaxID=61149 RepID=A0A2P2NE47_RHIMU
MWRFFFFCVSIFILLSNYITDYRK